MEVGAAVAASVAAGAAVSVASAACGRPFPGVPRRRIASFLYQMAPASTSGTNNPYGIRSWKWRTTATSVLGIDIASVSPTPPPAIDAAAIVASCVAVAMV